MCLTYTNHNQHYLTVWKLDGGYDSIDYYASTNRWQLQCLKMHFRAHLMPSWPWPFDPHNLMCWSLPMPQCLLVVKVWSNSVNKYQRYLRSTFNVWLGGLRVACRIGDRKVTGSTPAWWTASNNPGQVVNTRVPLFTKQYNLIPASPPRM